MKMKRYGFTLIETLVVLGIIGVLLAILFPAVQSVRESSRRTFCQNNLHQLSLAIQNHESIRGTIPNLYFGTFLKQPYEVYGEYHFHSWRTAILPTLEQSGLYERIDTTLPATVASNQANLRTSVSVFLCPSTSVQNEVVPDVLAFNDGQTTAQIIGSAARSDYEAIVGVIYPANPPRVSTWDPRGVRYGAWGEPKYNVRAGKSISYRAARLRDITDGLSNTALIGERSGRPDLHRRGTPADPYPYKDDEMWLDHHQAAWGISTHIAWLLFPYDQSLNQTNATGIYSFHSGGANVGLADGSVRFLSESMDQEPLNALATRAAGDVTRID